MLNFIHILKNTVPDVPNKDFGKTLITKTAGQKIVSDGLKGRVVYVSLADLKKYGEFVYRKIKLRI